MRPHRPFISTQPSKFSKKTLDTSNKDLNPNISSFFDRQQSTQDTKCVIPQNILTQFSPETPTKDISYAEE